MFALGVVISFDVFKQSDASVLVGFKSPSFLRVPRRIRYRHHRELVTEEARECFATVPEASDKLIIFSATVSLPPLRLICRGTTKNLSMRGGVAQIL